MANDGITVIDGAVGTGRNNDVMAKALASVGAADSLQVLQTQEAARLAAAHQTDIALSRAATSSAAAIANPATEIAEATIARVRASSAREGAAPAPVPQAETQTTVVSSGRATGPAAITTEGNVGDGAVIEIVGKRLPPKTLASDLPMVPEPVAPLDRTPMASAVDVAFPAMPRTSFAKLKEPEKEPSSMRR